MKVLLTENEIAARIAQLGGEITEAYRGKELTVIVMMNGAVIFAADLLRKIDLPLSYRIEDFHSRFSEFAHKQFITY